jgi:hypothetical protein
MQLALLGFIFVVGLFIYYLFSTRSDSDDDEKAKKKKDDENIKKEENVIYLTGDIEKMKKDHRKSKK